MVNIRFHIVSITAVFLSLAIGIFMGSSLLDRATVGSLTNTQRSLEEKIAERGAENDALRAHAERMDEVTAEFAGGPMRALLDGTVADQVLVIAARGVSPEGVDTVQSDLGAAGATLAGVVWWEPRAELVDLGVRTAVAEAVGADADAAAEVVLDLATEQLGETLGTVGGAPDPGPDAPGPDSDEAPPEQGEQPPDGAPVTTTTTLPEPGAQAATLLERLTSAGMLTWSVQGSVAPGPLITDQPLRVVIVSGEGAEEHQHEALRKLAAELAERMPGRVVACEMLDAAASTDLIQRSIAEPSLRGAFVEPLREDTAVSEAIASIDALDQPFGRFALLRLLGMPPAEATGAYGITESATSAFPPS